MGHSRGRILLITEELSQISLDFIGFEIGDEAFFGGLRAYFKRYGGAAASHEQFVQALEEASGKELDLFFEMWFAPGELPPVPRLPEAAPMQQPGG